MAWADLPGAFWALPGTSPMWSWGEEFYPRLKAQFLLDSVPTPQTKSMRLPLLLLLFYRHFWMYALLKSLWNLLQYCLSSVLSLALRYVDIGSLTGD